MVLHNRHIFECIGPGLNLKKVSSILLAYKEQLEGPALPLGR